MSKYFECTIPNCMYIVIPAIEQNITNIETALIVNQ